MSFLRLSRSLSRPSLIRVSPLLTSSTSPSLSPSPSLPFSPTTPSQSQSRLLPLQSFRMGMASAAPAPRFAEGEDPQQLGPDTDSLQQQGWALDADGMGVNKTFYFRSYFKATSFVNFIASESSVKKHHATITLRFGSVDVHWTTHHPRGLTHKDITMARHCDNGAGLMGAVEPGEGLKCGPSK